MITYCKSIRLRQVLKGYHIPFRTLTGLNCWNEELSVSLKHKIEKHWAPKLTHSNYNENDTTRDKYYVLSMFPYPSGNLHMGHVRVYTISDSIARFQRMNNKNVFHPIGWDAFGLPAENAAIERNAAPSEWTKHNILHMKKQLQKIGCSFEWDREVATCDPRYYRWTQELFIKLYESGLAYQKEALVNWDPVDQTVLADEQVDENCCSWRSGAKVERKPLNQWFIKTTSFAKALQDGLDDPLLQDWRDVTKIQKHWIGKCSGVAFDFALLGQKKDNVITLWTPNPECIENAEFVALTRANILANYEGEVLENGTKRLKVVARNPFNRRCLPIFVTDQIEFVPESDSYIGIPQVSIQDQEFCNKFNLNFTLQQINLSPEQLEAKQTEICQKAKQMNVGGYWTSAKLRDWLISRQRYWGTPIPIINCKACGTCPVPKQDLPVTLPKIDSINKKGTSALLQNQEWLNTTCPKCKGPATRETDTMDTFVDSSWYYLRYLDPHNRDDMFSAEKAKAMTPVDLYIGGKEHAALHLYYARFVSHFLHSLGMLPEREPFKRLLVQGMVMGRSFRIKGSGHYVKEDEINITDKKKNKGIHLKTQQPVVISWEKMSKSKQNGVDPTEMLEEYGIDTTRLLVLSDVAPTSHRHWNKDTFPGILNWQRKLWIVMQKFLNNRQNLPSQLSEQEFKNHEAFLFDSRNFYLKGVTFNYCTAQQHSVAISKMQGLTTSLLRVPTPMAAYSPQYERTLATLIVVLAPIAPHFASELWSGFVSAPNHLKSCNTILWDKNVLEQSWPDVDPDYHLDLICRVNGVDMATVKIPRHEIEMLSGSEALSIALEQKGVQENLVRKTVRRSAYQMYVGYRGEINIYAKVSSEDKIALESSQ